MPVIALDATYSRGRNLSGVGVYCREILRGLARRVEAEASFLWYYRPHRFLGALRERLPERCSRRLLQEPLVPDGDLFHGLNQRLPRVRLRHAVTTFHDLFVLTGEYSTAEFRARFGAQAREAAAASDAIICVSAFTASQVRDLLGIERARLHVIPHGLRLAAMPVLPREKIILHVGAIQTRKNLVRLVRVFGAMPEDWRLVLAGSAGFGADQVFAAIEASPARGRIQVTGWVPDRELADWYARASIFAFPSLDEGFGIPVLEAMAAGVPVVTSRRSALPEVAGDAAVLIDPLQEDELRHALATLAMDESLWNKHAARGKEQAAAFTWERAVRATWAVYELVLGRGRQG